MKPLLALPLIGTGGSGGVALTGKIIEMLVDLLPRLADEYAVDILLCVANMNDFMLVQVHVCLLLCKCVHLLNVCGLITLCVIQERRKERKLTWSQLTEENKQCAKKLADKAKRNSLCMFLGAGTSMPAGMPSWAGLLELVNKDLGYPLTEDIWTEIKRRREEYKQKGEVDENDVWVKNGKKWDDYLQIVEELHAEAQQQAVTEEKTPEQGTQAFKKIVARHTDMPKHCMGQAMLACIPARSAITTNYDTLFEKASHGVNAFGGRQYARDKMAVLPYAPKKECQRWLLKMHGCATRPDSIVLTAEDYEVYETSTAAALGGLVQAELMTAHMMFVGFSMTDANFMRLINSVMAAYGGEKREGAGTIVNLATPKQEMVDIFGEYGIATETAGAGYWFEPYDVNNPYNTNASREIEIFYDYLLLECTDTAYPIFEDKFETALSHHERVLRDHMDKFLTGEKVSA